MEKLETNTKESIAIAKRFYGNRAGNNLVDCNVRDYDEQIEMLMRVIDPTLTQEELQSVRARKLPPPFKWVTTDVVKPYVVEGIRKSLAKKEE